MTGQYMGWEHNDLGNLSGGRRNSDSQYDSDRQHYVEGYKAARQGREKDTNPYGVRREHTMWNRGFSSGTYDMNRGLGDFIS